MEKTPHEELEELRLENDQLRTVLVELMVPADAEETTLRTLLLEDAARHERSRTDLARGRLTRTSSWDYQK